MPFDSKKRSNEAQIRPRDRNGHFIPLKAKVDLSGQGKMLSELVKTEKDNDPFNILTVRMGKPWEKFIQILEDFKNKQNTKVNLSLTIPLIALPVVMILAFQLGKMQTECTTNFSTQIGTLQNITVVRKLPPSNFILKALSKIPYFGEAYLKEVTAKEAVLINPQNETILINNEANADLNSFNQGKVIIFGDYNSCSKNLSLTSPQNISNY